jgi:MoaA/NifB/PqqE/SkfB family radical SAM enzyme
MYIRLTSRCNMTCAHCAFSCTARGQDMDLTTFKAALELAQEHGQYVTLGGGEPTLHPQFWEFLGLAISSCDLDSGVGLFIVTNGSIKDKALALAKMAKSGLFGASLSQDRYHDPIDPEVVRAFTKPEQSRYGSERSNDWRQINRPGSIIIAGRAKKNGIGWNNICYCDELMVEPNGKLWMCGCRKISFGTIFDQHIPEPYWDEEAGCSRKVKHGRTQPEQQRQPEDVRPELHLLQAV